MITVVIPFLNDPDVINTVRSIRDTSEVEIIVVDDANVEPVKIDGVHYIRNSQRKGVDGSREVGVAQVTTDTVMVVDAHMRFTDGWAERLQALVDDNPQSVICTTSVSIFSDDTNFEGKRTLYGCDLYLWQDRRILSPEWVTEPQGGVHEIGCVMGANYICKTDWWRKIRGVEGLKTYGISEQYLSMKSYLAGGNCLIDEDTKIGHCYRRTMPSYSAPFKDYAYNKFFLIETLTDGNLRDELYKRLGHERWRRELDMELIEELQDYYKEIFVKRIAYERNDSKNNRNRGDRLQVRYEYMDGVL